MDRWIDRDREREGQTGVGARMYVYRYALNNAFVDFVNFHRIQYKMYLKIKNNTFE
jgi:hypothetical protein